jgi:hypothetical protein
MIPRRVLLLAPLALAAGCDTAPPFYIDPGARLADVPGGDAPLDKPAHVAPPVALVASAPTRRLLRSSEPPRVATGAAPGLNTVIAVAADADPQYFVSAAMGVLRKRWPDLVLVDDLPAAREGKFQTTLVLDLRAYQPASADTDHADITLVVMDATQKPLSRILAQGTSNTFSAHFRDAVDAAAQQLEQKISQLLN